MAWRQRRWWHPTPGLLPGKSHGQRSPVGCSPWGHSESNTTERLHFHFSPSCIGEGNGSPLQYSCLENPRDRGAWWAAIYGVAQSRTRLKWLSSSSSSSSMAWRARSVVCYSLWSQGLHSTKASVPMGFSRQEYPQEWVVTGGNNLKKNICITESLCYAPETNTPLQINYTSILKNLIIKITFLNCALGH